MMSQCVVRWNDGTYDRNRICDQCHRSDCKYPTYSESERYKEVITKKSYWDWLDKMGNEEGEKSHSAGAWELIEPVIANPDMLQETNAKTEKKITDQD